MIDAARPVQRPAVAEPKIGAASATRPLTGLDWLAGIVLLLALALRLYHLDYQSFWGDEAFALRIAREPFDNLLQALAGSEPHPPLYYGLLHVWRDLVGESDFALRLLSTLFSVIAVAAVYGLGRHIAGTGAGFGAALLTAANPFQVWYAQETRMYAMLVALTAWSVLLFYTAFSRGSRRRWVAYTVITALAIFTHYHALFVVLFENVIAGIWWLRTRRNAAGWLGSQALLLALFLPWLYFAQSIFRSWSGWMPLVDFPTMLTRSFGTHTLGTSFPPVWVDRATLGLGIWAALALAALLLRRRTAGMFHALYVLVPLSGAYVLGQLLGRSMFHERYLIVASPAFYLLLGYGFGWQRWRLPLTLCGILITLVLNGLSLRNHYFDAHYQKDDLRGLAGYVDAHAREGDLVVSSIAREGLYRRYAGGAVPLYVFPPEAQPSELEAALTQITAPYRRLWHLPHGDGEQQRAVDHWFAENTYRAETRWFNDARLSLAGMAAPAAPQSRVINFADRVRLEAYSLSANSFVPGDVVGLSLYWRREQRAGGEIKASLRLVDPRGHVYAQIDPPLGEDFRPVAAWSPDEVVRENYGLLLPADAPPGGYHVELRLYDAAERHDLPLRDGRDAALGTSLALRTIDVKLPTRPAPPSAQDVIQPAKVSFGEVAQLAGYGLPAGKWQAGEYVSITLNWRALQPDGQRYRPVLRLIDAGGSEVAKRAREAALPVARWRPGELVRDIHDWRLPLALQDGTCTVALDLERPDGTALPLGSGGTRFILGQVSVAARPDYTAPAPPEHPSAYTLGEFARLAGFDVTATTLHPGETLRLTLHWQAMAEPEENYKVFTHLLSADEHVWGQHDSIPCAGGCPTSSWAEREAIADQYTLTLQPDAPLGVYRIEVGMYRPSDGRRLPVVDAAGQPVGDRIILGEVTAR